MPVPTVITDLSTTAASNFPAGSDAPSTIDDTLRAHGAFIRENYNRLTDGTDAITCAQLTASGASVTGSGGIGYGAGSGGTVTQGTDKSTAVTLNKMSGQITTHAASLAGGASVVFIVNNSLFGANDVVVPQIASAALSTTNYSITAATNGAGSFHLILKNETAGALAEAVVIGFVVLKVATS
jgi:hypothetical protein